MSEIKTLKYKKNFADCGYMYYLLAVCFGIRSFGILV